MKKEPVIDCQTIGGSASKATIQKIVLEITPVVKEMIRKTVAHGELIRNKFSCKIETNFETVERAGVVGFLFEVRVTHNRQIFTMKLCINPSVIDAPSEIVWKNQPSTVETLKEEYLQEFQHV